MTVYFIAGPDLDGPVKIGTTSNNAAFRMASLQCGSPVSLRLLAELPDEGVWGEKWFHDICAEARLHGEWFRRTELVKRILFQAIVHGHFHGFCYNREKERWAEDCYAAVAQPTVSWYDYSRGRPWRPEQAMAAAAGYSTDRSSFDRTAYQREYMRRRRAAARAMKEKNSG